VDLQEIGLDISITVAIKKGFDTPMLEDKVLGGRHIQHSRLSLNALAAPSRRTYGFVTLRNSRDLAPLFIL